MVSVDEEGAVTCDVVDVSSLALRTYAGLLVAAEAGRYRIELTSQAHLAEGIRVVLNVHTASHLRVVGTVEEACPGLVWVRERRVQTPDKRAYPRMAGGIFLRYRVVSAEQAQRVHARQSWLAGSPELGDAAGWRTPSPLMNFSVTGLCFDDSLHVELGDLLLCEFATGPDLPRWRATARVMRIAGSKAPSELAPGATHQISVEFESMPTAAIEHLTAYTLRLQQLGL